ncbi:MAG: MEDS domain-containing protein [Pseudonocardiaceae bacterium]
MAVQPSFSGCESFPDLQLGDHWCLPVDGDADRLGGTARFAELGLCSGGKVVVFTAGETPDEMAAFLADRLPGAAAALTAGQLAVLDCRDVYLTDGTFDPATTVSRYLAQIDLAEQQGYPGLWAAVDMAWIQADRAGIGLLADYEAAVNPGFADRRVAAVCVYDRSRICPTLVEEICGAHPLTPGQAPLRFASTTDPPGLALSGEADLTNHRALTALLTPLHEAPGHITIDATGLHFADLRTADLLSDVSIARPAGATTVHGSPVVNRLLELVADYRSMTGGPPSA